MQIFAAEINDRGVIAFACASEAEAKAIAEQPTFRVELKRLEPQWDGRSVILRRPRPDEAQKWRSIVTVWGETRPEGVRSLKGLVYLVPDKEATQGGHGGHSLDFDTEIDVKIEQAEQTIDQGYDTPMSRDKDRSWTTLWDHRNHRVLLLAGPGPATSNL